MIPVDEPPTVDARGPATFAQVVARRALELTERIDAQLADDAESDIAPAQQASDTCKRMARRIVPHVALAPHMKVAAFTEDSSGVSLVFQSLITDRRLNLRIAPDGAAVSAIYTDELMDVRVRLVRDDDPDLARELAEWVTSRT